MHTGGKGGFTMRRVTIADVIMICAQCEIQSYDFTPSPPPPLQPYFTYRDAEVCYSEYAYCISFLPFFARAYHRLWNPPKNSRRFDCLKKKLNAFFFRFVRIWKILLIEVVKHEKGFFLEKIFL